MQLDLKLEHFDRLLNTPALQLAVAGWHELLLKRFADPAAQLVQYDHKAILARRVADGCPVGVLTWIDQAWSNQLEIVIAYVVPDNRMLGVHNALWSALVAKGTELGRARIASSTAIDNSAARAAMQRQKRRETGLFVVFDLPGHG